MPTWMISSEEDRIVGGQEAPFPIPWMVSVRPCYSGGCHKCGGTILDEMTVMSAARCFPPSSNPTSVNGYYVLAGATDKTKSGQVSLS